LRCDVLIVGCGITDALMAEQLTRQGLDVVIMDRELPGRGSTAASTSMLLWEIDRSLTELTAARSGTGRRHDAREGGDGDRGSETSSLGLPANGTICPDAGFTPRESALVSDQVERPSDFDGAVSDLPQHGMVRLSSFNRPSR
jgi:glycine/D-amino acid oxidase-like deaminating enzyme